MDPQLRTMIPALSLSHCINLRLVLGAAPGVMRGFRLGGGWIGFGKMF